VVTEPDTANRTVIPGVGLWKESTTVAVTQCCAPTVFESAEGVSVSAAGAPAVHVFVAVSDGSPASFTPFLFVSAKALIVSVPVAVPV
jgi:hypothetical protein